MTDVSFYLGDCLDIMPTIPAGSIDAIITDLPYGTTACKWDEVIPFAPMWEAVKLVLKPRGVFVTTASQPFTSKLVMSNSEWFKYCWVWIKNRATGYLDANKRPLKAAEDICIFSQVGYCTYNPVMREGGPVSGGIGKPAINYQFHNRRKDRRDADNRFPVNTIYFDVVQAESQHPTQKPIALYEYLILTYTNPGETVLDMCAGSGTTGVAAVKTGRNAILIEKDTGYFEIMQRRIAEAQAQPRLEGV